MDEKRFSLISVSGLVLANLFLIWLSPYLPLQDLPQHLANAHIIKRLADSPFYSLLYEGPKSFESYHALYYLLGFLGPGKSIFTALKLLLSLYVVAMGWIFYKNGRNALLCQLVLWNSALMMGFMSYALTLPFFLLILTTRGWQTKDKLIFISSSVLINSIHILAGGLVLLCLAVKFLFDRSREQKMRMGIYFAVFLVLNLSFASFLGDGKGGGPGFFHSYVTGMGLEFITNIFKADFSNIITLSNFTLWGTTGPFRIVFVLINLVVFIPLFKKVFLVRSQLKFELVLLGIMLLFPWGIYWPSEVTYLNFRFIPFVFALILLKLDFKKMSYPLILSCLIFVEVMFGFLKFNHQAKGVVSMVESIPRNKVLGSLLYQNDAPIFSKIVRATHFLPMYYTVLKDGANTQFWADYTSHLPVSYKNGKSPVAPNDWHPWKFSEEHLGGADYYLVQSPYPNLAERNRIKSSQKAVQLLQTKYDKLQCFENWCLFKNRN